jgi:hypothetical protein
MRCRVPGHALTCYNPSLCLEAYNPSLCLEAVKYAGCLVLIFNLIQREQNKKRKKELGWLVLNEYVVAKLGVNQIRRLGRWLLFHILEHLSQKRC